MIDAQTGVELTRREARILRSALANDLNRTVSKKTVALVFTVPLLVLVLAFFLGRVLGLLDSITKPDLYFLFGIVCFFSLINHIWPSSPIGSHSNLIQKLHSRITELNSEFEHIRGT